MKFSNYNFFSETKTETHFKFSTYSKSLEPAANYFRIGRTNRLMIEIDLDDQRNTRLNVSNKNKIHLYQTIKYHIFCILFFLIIINKSSAIRV